MQTVKTFTNLYCQIIPDNKVTLNHTELLNLLLAQWAGRGNNNLPKNIFTMNNDALFF